MRYDELATFAAKVRIENSALGPMVASLFERTRYANRTKQNPIRIDNARLGFLASCTSETYENLWTRNEEDLGLLNRSLPVVAGPKPKVGWPSLTDDAYNQKLAALGTKIKSQLAECTLGEPWTYDITPDARRLWEEWCDNLPNLDSKFARRLDAIGFRLMPIFVATTDKKEVDAEVIRAVIAILDYAYLVRQRFAPVIADNANARVEEKIRRVLASGPMTRRDLARAVHADRCGGDLFERVLAGLVGRREVVLHQGTGLYELVS